MDHLGGSGGVLSCKKTSHILKVHYVVLRKNFLSEEKDLDLDHDLFIFFIYVLKLNSLHLHHCINKLTLKDNTISYCTLFIFGGPCQM